MSRFPTLLIVLAVSMGASPSFATCRAGTVSVCTCPSGLQGERICSSGHPGPCICEAAPQPCQTCGRASYLDDTGTCIPLDETCNGCDDDSNGAVDDGIYCIGTGPFTPRCTANSSVPVSLGSINGMLPANRNTGGYANNLQYTARIHTNPLVDTVTFDLPVRRVNLFDTLFAWNLTNYAVTDLHDNALFGPSVTFSLLGTGQPGGVEFHFSTDSAVTDVGWWISDAQVTCGPARASGAAALPEDDVDSFGLLTASDDVVFFQLPVGPEPLSVWIEASSPWLDADLYARYDALPERNVYDFSSAVASRGDEWINIDSPASGHQLYLAVHSRSGGGAFNIRTARVLPDQRWSSAASGRPLRVATDFLASPAQRDLIVEMLRGAQRFMIGMTEGKVQLREIELYVRSSCFCDNQWCDVCVHGATGRANSFAEVHLFSDQWTQPRQGSRVVGHELGHYILGLDDEYRDHGFFFETCKHSDHRCPASVMDDQSFSNNLCVDSDHGRDPAPLGHVCASCPFPGTFLSGQSCTISSCNACFATDASSWADVLARGKVYSRPYSTPNFRSYEFYRGLPANVHWR